MSRPVNKQLRLLHILVQEASVPPNVAEWIATHADGPQCETPADFAQLWSAGTVEDGPKVDVLDIMPTPIDVKTFAGRRLAGRLRTAWQYCQQDTAGEAKSLAEPPKAEEENDTQSWPDARRKSCADEVFRLYRLTLQPNEVPASTIMNRLDRLWRDRKPELLQLAKMKTQADAELLLQGPAKERSLGIECGEAQLIMRQGPRELPPCDLGSVDQVLQAFEVMANGWLLLGTAEEKSSDPAKDTVQGFDINDVHKWNNFMRKMARSARQSGDSEATIVRYLRVREHQTRTAALPYWRDHSYPWGEALTKALQVDMAVLWTVTGHTNAFGIQVSIPGITDQPGQGKRGSAHLASAGEPPARRPRHEAGLLAIEDDPTRGLKKPSLVPREWQGLANNKLEQKMLCPDFQKGTCPAATPRDCPRGLLHRCDKHLPGGGFCGSSQHGRNTCSRKNGKGEGKGGKGGKGQGKNGKGGR